MADRIGGWRSCFTLHPAPSTSEQAPVGGRQDDTVDLASATDGRLLDAVGAGSQPAMRELFMRHGVAAYGLACLLTPDEEKAAAAVADVFVRLWRRGGRMDHAVDHVRLGLLAMTGRCCLATTPAVGEVEVRSQPRSPDAVACDVLRRLPVADRHMVAVALLCDVRLCDLASAFGADQHRTASRVRAGLRLVHQGIEENSGKRCTEGADGSAPRRFPESRA
ncbi:MAG TPA: hypothetical protein VGV86_17345 [Acidimicrobiales bacterium]|nr:hypothetical protein [Acidimicrobiales bacterium]